jgi:hypothetical protein
MIQTCCKDACTLQAFGPHPGDFIQDDGSEHAEQIYFTAFRHLLLQFRASAPPFIAGELYLRPLLTPTRPEIDV